MTALTTCTVNFNDLYLKSNIGKVSHYRTGILFDHLICLNISVRLKGAYGKAGIRNPESGIRNRSRKRKRKRNPNPNLRNKTWRRFCLNSVTNNYCSIKTFHPHIIFIYCYYIFYCRIFCVLRKIFLREFHICVSVATWDHD